MVLVQTRESRAIAFTSALAAHWRLSYSPKLSDSAIDPHSLLDGCLPAFLAMVLLSSLSAALPLAVGVYLPSVPPANAVLAVAVCVVSAHQTSHLGEIGLISGALAGVLIAWPLPDGSSGGSVVSGLAAGILVGWLCPRCLASAFRLGFPATVSPQAICRLRQ